MSLPVFRAVAHPWHCDVMGHVTTRHYVAMFDDASYHALHAIFGWSGADAGDNGIGMVDVRQEIDFNAEVKAGDLLEIHAHIEKLGGKSASIGYEMVNLTRDEPAARLLQVIVCFDMNARKAMPWPDDMRNNAEPFLMAG